MTITIIGGGAAGMMAAATINELSPESEVFLIEKNKILGQKVIISGGGRCNVTTGFTDLKVILKKYPRGEKFLRQAMYNFPPEKLCQWIENQGVPLKTEKDLRIFPKSDNGKDIVKLFEKILAKNNTKILFKTSAKLIEKRSNKFVIHLSNGQSQGDVPRAVRGQTLESDKVILTAGGQAYRHTGSTGDGYKLAENLGHHTTQLAPSLSAFLVEEKWVKELSGVSFQNAKLKLIKTEKYEFQGPILFTHQGITGPAIFAISSLSAFEKIDKINQAKLYIDFCPEITYENLSNQLQEHLKQEPKKLFYNILSPFAPKSFIKSICERIEIPATKINSEISKKSLNQAIEALKNTQITLIGQSAGDEFVTAGGIELSEVNPQTMESKICPSLYFAGEILNIDGFTGGFNLQAAWATGRLAGQEAQTVTQSLAQNYPDQPSR